MNISQQVIGVINLSLPVIVLFYFFPFLLTSLMAIMMVSIVMGIYIWYLNFAQHKNAMLSLLYVPTGAHKERFEQLIRSCGVSVDEVILKYAYTAEQIAMTMGNTIIIDPTLCSFCDDDPGAGPVKNVFEQVFVPKLTTAQVQRMVQCKENLSSDVQSFIFKHELGHIIDNYSTKKLMVIFLTGTLSVCAGILAAQLFLVVNVMLAIFLGMLVGGISDILLTYVSNMVFKFFAEKRADFFAAQHSTVEEIEAAAYFFKKHQEIIDQYKDSTGFFSRLPSFILTGHPTGAYRSNYLLQIAQQKRLS